MANLAGMTAMEWDAMALTIARIKPGATAGQRPLIRADAMPILEGLRALACEIHECTALGAGTDTALALLETARQMLRGVFAPEMLPLPETADRAEPPANGGLAGWQIYAVTRHIDSNLDGTLRLASLARVVRLSPSYLCRACRQTLQCSPMQYVMQRRLLAAKRLLRDSPIPLSELALNCGFADQAHFTRVFRTFTGETPLRWRRMWQNAGLHLAVAGALPQTEAHCAL